MIYLTSENELSLEGMQYLYFYASWMPFHWKMQLMISKMEKKYNIIFQAIDTDNFKSLCKRFAIQSIPDILILKEGQEIKRINGLVMTSALKSVLADICDH